MRRAIFVGIILAISLAIYAVGIVIMLSNPDTNSIPTPADAVVGAALAMFATLGVFVTGFVWLSTEPG
ncbi:MAG: hypothetical protein ACJ72G_09400 [Friedmanniella sp.]|jgi:hypothetical protein